MPTLDMSVEFLAGVEDTVVVVLVVDWTGETVAKHAFRKGRQGIDRVLAQKRRSRRVVPFTRGSVGI